MQAGSKHKDLLKLVPPGDNYLYFTAERGYPNPIFKWRSRYWSFLLKLSPDRPSWTIQASFTLHGVLSFMANGVGITTARKNDIDTAKLVAFDLFDELHEVQSQIQPYGMVKDGFTIKENKFIGGTVYGG